MKRRAHSIRRPIQIWRLVGGMAVYDDDFLYMILSVSDTYDLLNADFEIQVAILIYMYFNRYTIWSRDKNPSESATSRSLPQPSDLLRQIEARLHLTLPNGDH